jgi:glycosyltransferase involved in cell wall biosynthesis
MGTEKNERLATVVTLAPFVPRQPTSGHTYWFHRSLSVGFRLSGITHLTFGPKASSNEFVSGVLNLNPARRIQFAYFPILRFFAEVRRVSRRLAAIPGEKILHVYEGGLREFLTAAWLLKKHPESKAYFNFCLVDPWLQFLTGRRATNRRLQAFLRIYSAIESRVVFTAESLELFEKLGLPGAPLEYPLFSDLPRPTVQTNRLYDIVFAPMGDSELDVCLESVRRLRSTYKIQPKFMVHMRWGTLVPEDLQEEIVRLGGLLKNDKISPEAYAELYEQSTVAVLPYQTYSHYTYQSSGRLLDALALGCKVVVPKNTVLARNVSDLQAGSMVDPFKAGEISEAIHELLAQPTKTLNLDVFDAQATAMEIVRAVKEKLPSAHDRPASVGVGDTLVAGLGFILATPRSFITGLLSALGLPMALLGRLLAKFSRLSKNQP